MRKIYPVLFVFLCILMIYQPAHASPGDPEKITVAHNVAPLAATGKATMLNCYLDRSGKVEVTVTGGVPPYTYSAPWIAVNETSAICIGLPVGIYICTVTDADGTTVNASATVTQPSQITASESFKMACVGQPNGKVTLTVRGGAGGYAYSWSGDPGNTTNVMTGAGGNYVCTITDLNGCVVPISTSIGQAMSPVIISTPTSPTCTGRADGKVEVQAIGFAPYTYAWSPSGGTASIATGLTAGDYTCTVTDANGCISAKVIPVSAPAAITVTSTHSDVSCNGGANGDITVVAAGGAGNFTYNWSPSGGTQARAQWLTEGPYSCAITDGNGCSITESVTVSAPPPLSVTMSSIAETAPGANDGTATVSPSGGTPPYTYSWTAGGGNAATTTNLPAGYYSCDVTDAKGCATTIGGRIVGPTTLSNFPALYAKYGDPFFGLNPPTSNGYGGFTYTSSNPEVATIFFNLVMIQKPGTTTITATQLATADHAETSITARLTVDRKELTAILINRPAITKEYDGTTNATIAADNFQISGILGTDDVTISGDAQYDSKDAGMSKVVTVNRLVVAGTQRDYYALVGASTRSTTGSITQKPLTGSINPIIKMYDGTPAATVIANNPTAANGLVGSDEVAITVASAAFDTKNVGNNKPITLTSPALTGADAGNYLLNTLSAVGSIIPKPITVTVTPKTKVYGSPDPEFAYNVTYGNLAPGDAFTGGLSRNTGENTGPYTINNENLSAGANYITNVNSAAFIITPAPLTITADNTEMLRNDKIPALTASYYGFVNHENESVITTTPQLSTTATPSAVPGDYPITVTGAVADNYDIRYVNGTLTVKALTPASLLFTPVPLYENMPAGTVAGSLSSSSDDASDIFTYTLVPGTGDADNALFAINGATIVTTAKLDFETKATLSVRVRVLSHSGGSIEKILSIAVQDVNESPTIAPISNKSICYTTTSQTVPVSGISTGPETQQNYILGISADQDLFSQLEVVKATSTTATILYTLKENVNGNVNITVRVTDNGGKEHGSVDEAETSFQLTVTKLPVFTISSNQPQKVSSGEEVVLTATGDALQYNWSDPSGDIENNHSAALTVRPTQTTTYTARGFINSCYTEQSYKVEVADIVVVKPPTIAPISNTSICYTTAPQTVPVAGISAGPDAAQTYTLGVSADKELFSQLEIVTATSTTATIRYALKENVSGNVNIQVIVTNNGGEKVATSFQLTVTAMPVFTISSNKPQKISSGEEIVLTATGNALQYNWSDPSGDMENNHNAALTVRPKQTTTYTAKGFINNCYTEQSYKVEVQDTVIVTPPVNVVTPANVVTPNGDGINDKWVIKDIERYPGNVVKIFDRSGRLIYNITGYRNEWDGTLNGRPLSEGVYFYIIDLKNGTPVTKGYITIVKNK